MLEFYDILTSWGALVTGRRLPLQKIPKITDNSPANVPFACKPSNPKSIAQPPSLSNCHTPGQYFPCPKSIQGQNQTTRDHLRTQRPPTLFRLFNPKLFILLCLAFPTKNTTKALNHALSSLLMPSDETWCFPTWPSVVWHALLLESVSNKFF